MDFILRDLIYGITKESMEQLYGVLFRNYVDNLWRILRHKKNNISEGIFGIIQEVISGEISERIRNSILQKNK